MSAWQIILLCWVCYIAGFFTAALMAAARDDSEREEFTRSAGQPND